MLSDDRLKFKKPIIRVNELVVDQKFVSVQQDRIQIQLPATLKAAAGIGSGPCSPRRALRISADVYYAVPKGIWPIDWNSEQQVNFTANTILGADQFDVTVLVGGTQTTVAHQRNSFTSSSQYVSVGCEEQGNGAATYTFPADAEEINCTPMWVNSDNLKSEQPGICTVGGTTASATGPIFRRSPPNAVHACRA
jgi:hypothetical protein